MYTTTGHPPSAVPDLLFAPHAWIKLMHMCRLGLDRPSKQGNYRSSIEVGAIGFVKQWSNVVEKIWAPPQENRAAHYEMLDEHPTYMPMMEKICIEEGFIPRLQIHTHPGFAPTPSPEDLATFHKARLAAVANHRSPALEWHLIINPRAHPEDFTCLCYLQAFGVSAWGPAAVHVQWHEGLPDTLQPAEWAAELEAAIIVPPTRPSSAPGPVTAVTTPSPTAADGAIEVINRSHLRGHAPLLMITSSPPNKKAKKMRRESIKDAAISSNPHYIPHEDVHPDNLMPRPALRAPLADWFAFKTHNTSLWLASPDAKLLAPLSALRLPSTESMMERAERLLSSFPPEPSEDDTDDNSDLDALSEEAWIKAHFPDLDFDAVERSREDIERQIAFHEGVIPPPLPHPSAG